MAVRELVEYLIRVTGDTAGAESKLGRLAAEATKAGAAVGAVAAGFAAAGAGAIALANDLTDAVDRAHTLAASTGLAAKEVTALEAAARSAGKGIENVLPKDLAKRIIEVSQGTGEAKAAWDELGVSATDAAGGLRSSSDVLRDLIDRIGQVEDPTRRAALAEKALGSEARELVQVMRDSGDFDAWIGYAEKYGTDVGPEAVRVTAKWQQSMEIFHSAMLATKSGLMPLVDILADTVTGFSAMAVFAANAAGSLMQLNNPFKVLKDGFDGVKDWVGSVRDLNAELGNTADEMQRIDKNYAEFVASLGFDPGTKGLMSIIGNVTAGRGLNGEAPPGGGGKPPKGGAGRSAKAAPGWDADINVAKLEEEQAALGEELRANREALLASTAATVDLSPLLEGLGDAMEVYAIAQQRTAEEALSGAAATAQSALDPVAAISGSVQSLAGIIGGAADMVSGVTNAIETLPEQLIALPEAVSGLIGALGGLVPALIEASPEIALAIADAMLSTALVSVEVIAQTLGALFEQLPWDIAQAIGEALRDLTGALNPFNGDGKFLGGIAERIPFFEDGGTVNRTGLAVVHAGETVVPAADSSRMRGGGGPSVSVHMVTPDPRMAAQDLSAALGPYGLGGLSLGGVR